MMCWVIVEDSLAFFKEKKKIFIFRRNKMPVSWVPEKQPEPESDFCIRLFSWNKQTIIVNVVLSLFFQSHKLL